jgi:hypothetical protein
MNLTRRKLQDHEVRALRLWWARREELRAEVRKVPTPGQMAHKLNIACGSVYQIARGRTYKEIR